MTTAVARPAPPIKAATLIVPVLAIALGMGVAGLIAVPTFGLAFGALSALALIYGLRLAGVELSFPKATAVTVVMTVFGFLTLILISEAATFLTPWIAFLLGALWLITGATLSVTVAPKADRTATTNVALLWALGGVMVAPMASTLGILPVDDEVVGLLPFVVAGLIAGLIGGGALLSAITGVRTIAIIGTTIVVSVFAASQVDFTLFELIANIANIAKAPEFWPPDFGWAVGEGVWWNIASWDFGSPTLANPLIETFRIGILASIFGCLVALPVAFMASTVTAPNRITYLLDKSFMNVIRTIPDLFWAMLFVAGIGLGPFAGVLALFFFTLAIMSKLLSETVDSVDPGPLEAAEATGGSHFPAVRVSVLPQVLPNYVAYAMYVFEISIRASVVLGLVGAGGIGRVLEAQRVFFQFDRVMAVVIIIFVIVFLIEQISVALRRRLV